MYIFKLIRQFKAATGRSPTPNELSKLKQQAEAMSAQDNIIQFPEGGIDSVPVDKQFGGRKSLKEFTEAEDAFEASKLRGNETFDELIDPTRIKGGISTRIKLNSFRENEQYAKDLIGGKSSEFNILKGDDRKEILDLLDEEITKGKTPPTSTDDMPFAAGGLAGALAKLQKKFGKKIIQKGKAPKKSEKKKLQDLFREFNKKNMARGGLAYMLGEEPRSEYGGGGLAGAPPVTYDDNIDNIGPGPTMPPNTMMNTPAVDPKMFNQGTGTGVMIDPRGLQQGKLQIPTQGLADGGRIGYMMGSEVVDETEQEKMFREMKNVKVQAAIKLAEEKNIGIGKAMSITNSDDFNLKTGKYEGFDETIKRMLNMKAYGGRIGFKKGGMDRRSFLKLMGGLAALPIVGKFFKGAKVASKVVPLKGTTTTMPAWFPKFVDKVMDRGVGTKIDADIMKYEVKELPGIQVTKHDDGRIYVEGQNDYYKSYDIEYQPPGYEVTDYKTGKAVKTKGDFTASEEVPVNMDPDGNVDFDGEILESVDDILTSDARTMEEFATGSKIKNPKRGEQRVGEAEVRLENEADAYAERMAEEADEFASGGIAKLLGE